MQSVLVMTIVGISIPTNVEVYLTPLYVIKLVNYLLQVQGFLNVLQFPTTIKLTAIIQYTDITEISLNGFKYKSGKLNLLIILDHKNING